MDHEKASQILMLYASGEIAGEAAAALEAHVAICQECQTVLDTHRRVAREVAEHGEALFTDHPDSDALVRFALGHGDLSAERSAAIEAHIGACPTCALEASYARDVLAERGAVRRSDRLRTMTGRRFVEAVAAAALLAMLYPAYLGVVKLPALRRAQASARAEITDLQQTASRLRKDVAESERARQALAAQADWSGGASFAFLTGPYRGSDGALSEVTLQPGQPFLTILVDLDGSGISTRKEAPPVRARLLDLQQDRVVWQDSALQLFPLVDPVTRVIGLMLPTADLAAGAYRLEIKSTPTAGGGEASAREGTAAFIADFRIGRHDR